MIKKRNGLVRFSMWMLVFVLAANLVPAAVLAGEGAALPEITELAEETATPPSTDLPDTVATPEPTATPEPVTTPDPTATPEPVTPPEPTAAPDIAMPPESAAMLVTPAVNGNMLVSLPEQMSGNEPTVSVLEADGTSLIVDALPYGAEVLLDGSFVGVTDREIAVAPGRHTLSVCLKGFVSSAEYSVNAAEGKQTTIGNIPALRPNLPESPEELTIAVTTAQDVVDGDHTDIAALKANPGGDGISLREAVMACGHELTDSIKRINFDPSLSNTAVAVDTRWQGDGTGTIVLTDGICVNGDIDGDGAADVTVTDAYPGGDSAHIFTAWANDITVASIKFEEIVRGIAFAPYNHSRMDGRVRMNIENITVINCDFTVAEEVEEQDIIDSVAIQTTAAGYYNSNFQYFLDKDGQDRPVPENEAEQKAAGFTDFSLSGMTFTGNRFAEIFAVWILASGNVGGQYDAGSQTMTGGYENDGVFFGDITIGANRASGSTSISSISMVVTDCNSAQDRYNFPNTADYTYAENCQLNGVLIRGNRLEVNDREAWGIMAYNSNMGNSGNTLSGVTIDYNDITAETSRSAILFGNSSGNDHSNAADAQGNLVKDIAITNNHIRANGGGAVAIYNATADTGPSQDNNTIENLTIADNDIEIELTAEVSAIYVTNANADQASPHYSSNNTMRALVISGNRIGYLPGISENGPIEQLNDWDVVSNHQAAISVISAITNEAMRQAEQDSIAENNRITELEIMGNEVAGAVCSLNLEAGRGKNAEHNSLSATVTDNHFSGRFYAFDSMQGAADNGIQVNGDRPCRDITADFTDPVFLAEIKPFTNRQDGFVFDADVAEIKELSVPGQGINSLSGLQHFTALETLNCAANDLTEIDVTGLTKLTALFCGDNCLPAKAAIIGLDESRVTVDFGTQKAPPPAALQGAVIISGTAIYGGMLTADISGLSSEPLTPDWGIIYYQWKRDGENIPDAVQATYQIGAADLACLITVEVSASNCTGSVTAAGVMPTKAEQGPPPMFTMTYAYDPDQGCFIVELPQTDGMEYSFDGSAFSKTERTVTADPEASVIGYMRYAETDTHNTGSAVSQRLALPAVVSAIIVTGENGSAEITLPGGSLQMWAEVLPENAAQAVAWSITDGASCAAVDPVGLVTAIADGTVTVRATAADGTGIYGELEITVSGQSADELTALSLEPFLTMDQNETRALTLTYLPANTSLKGVTWSSNNKAVAAVDENGMVTAVGEGSATITARSSQPGFFRRYAYCWVKVQKEAVTPTEKTINITAESGTAVKNPYRANAYTMRGNLTDTKAIGTNGRSLDAPIVLKADSGVTWKSNDTKVVKVTAVKKTKTQLENIAKVVYTGSGTATITAVSTARSGDLKGVSATITVTVNDQKPKLPAAGITYYELVGQAALTVLPTDNFKFGNTEGINCYNGLKTVKKPGRNQDRTHELFVVEPGTDNTSFILKFSATADKPEVNRKYTLYLQATKDGDKDENLVGDPFSVTVNYVARATPRTTVKMPPALNTFWQDAAGTMTITTGVGQPAIVDVKLVKTNQLRDGNIEENFEIASWHPTPAGAEATVAAKPAFIGENSFTDVALSKPAVKGILKVYFAGFGRTDAEKEAACAKINVTIPIKPIAPKLNLTPAVQIVSLRHEKTAKITIISAGQPVSLAEAVKTAAPANRAIEGEVKLQPAGSTVMVKLLDEDPSLPARQRLVKASNTLQLNIRLAGARTDSSVKPLLIKPTIKTTAAATVYKLSAATVTFGGGMSNNQVRTLNIVPSAANDGTLAMEQSDVAFWDEKTKDRAAKAGLELPQVTENGTLTVTVPPAAAKTAGSYKVKIWPNGPPPDNTATGKKAHPQLALTIKIDSKPLTAAVRAERGNIDLMARETTGLSYLPTVKNTGAAIRAVDFAVIDYQAANSKAKAVAEDNIARAKEKLQIEMTGGKVLITAKTDKAFNTGEQFKVRLKFTLEDGNTAMTGTLTIKPAQSRVRHSIPMTTLYQSRTMGGSGQFATVRLEPLAPSGAGIKDLTFKEETARNQAAGPQKYVNNPNSAYWYSFDVGSQELHIWIRDSELVRPGRVTLTFSAVYEGQGLLRYKDVNGKWIDRTGQNGKQQPSAPKPTDLKIPVNVLK